MRKFIVYLLSVFLATAAWGAEFDPTTFPVANEAEKRFRDAWLAAPENPAASLEAFRALRGDQRLPGDAVLWSLALYSFGGESTGALEEIARLGPTGPFYAEALGRLAAEREAAGDWAGARERLEKLLGSADSDKARAAVLSNLLRVTSKGGDEAGARKIALTLYTKYAEQPASEAAQAFLEKSGNPLDALTIDELYLRAKTLLDSGSRSKAVEAFNHLRNGAKKEASWPALDLGLGKALHYLRRYQESLEPLTRAAKQAKDAEMAQSAAFWRARSLFGLDRGNEGAPELVKLAKRYPGASKAPQWLYQAYRVFEGRSMGKEAASAKTLLLKSHPNSDEAVEVRLTEARALYRDGKFTGAAAGFEKAVATQKRGWTRAEGLFWAARSYDRGGAREKAEKAWKKLLAEYPVGYYARAAATCRAECNVNLWIDDARGKGGKRIKTLRPDPADLVADSEAEKAARYLRLGMAEAARSVLTGLDEGRYARLRYWAEDFKGALKASGADWTEWPPEGSGDKRFFFPLAYPSSVTLAALESDVHPHLILAISHTESHFDPDAYSPWEARGLMQFIPATAKVTADSLAIGDFRDEMLFEPETALRLGAKHLRDLLDRFDGNMVNAIAAYNAGDKAVAKWRAEIKYADEAEFVERIPYKETRRYVKKVLTAIDAYDRMGGEGGLWP